jgi:two-component system NtrC family response regulator
VRELQTHHPRHGGAGPGRAANLESWLGRSPAARRVTRLIHSLAASDDPVLVLGEPGTGRELASQALHAIAGRDAANYVALDVTEDLPPVASLPPGGTYWIEDITRLSAAAHARFPEWAESAGERGRVIAGGPVDLAERAATHDVPTGTYNFLAALTVSLPPLRERPEDIVIIATAMIGPLAARVGVADKQLSDEALTRLSRYSWPGNLQELERRLTGALFVSSDDTVTDDDLWPQSLAPKQLGLKGNLNVLERSLVERAVREHRGNVSQAARSLSVSRPTLHSLLRKHDIDPEPFRVVGGAG